MRRRTRPRVAWLPQTNANSIGTGDLVYQLVVIGVGGVTGSRTTFELPLVLDNPQSAVFSTDPSLSDIESSGYRLRRIVGKVWVQMAQSNQAATQNNMRPSSVIVTAGIMVRRVEPPGASSLSGLVNINNVSPALIENSGDPWVWRRSWVLGDNQTDDVAAGGQVQFFPTINWGSYGGGIAEGPHVDQKTARIVATEERLFMNVTATILSEASNQAQDIPATIAVFTDLRVLGSLRTNVGNRRNASR